MTKILSKYILDKMSKKIYLNIKSLSSLLDQDSEP